LENVESTQNIMEKTYSGNIGRNVSPIIREKIAIEKLTNSYLDYFYSFRPLRGNKSASSNMNDLNF
jgi:hypothetical protein